jgi:hypothetical protein
VSEERCWFAPVPDRPEGAWAAAEARDVDGRPAGWLAAWRRRSKPVRDALLADASAFDPEGEPAWASLVWLPRTVRIIFDDLAVQHARRRALAEGDAAALTTFARDASTFGGALSAWRGPRAAQLAADDPFARVFGARTLQVGPGLLGITPPLPAPVIERYGGQPWPAGRFPPAS